MTDGTQELDVILNEVRCASWSMGLQSSSQEDLHSSSNNGRGTSEAKQAILDWHNKQLEEVLVHISEYAENVASVDENGEFRMKAIPLSLIAVEINKLKEAEL